MGLGIEGGVYYRWKENQYLTFLIDQLNELRRPYVRGDIDEVITRLEYLIAFLPSYIPNTKTEFARRAEAMLAEIKEELLKVRKEAMREVAEGRADYVTARKIERRLINHAGLKRRVYELIAFIGRGLEPFFTGMKRSVLEIESVGGGESE